MTNLNIAIVDENDVNAWSAVGFYLQSQYGKSDRRIGKWLMDVAVDSKPVEAQSFTLKQPFIN